MNEVVLLRVADAMPQPNMLYNQEYRRQTDRETKKNAANLFVDSEIRHAIARQR